MDSDYLNEVATLLHVTSEIATNHPNLAGISRACQRRLSEINQECVEAEAREVTSAQKQASAKQARDYKAPTPDSPEPEYVSSDEAPAVERRV